MSQITQLAARLFSPSSASSSPPIRTLPTTKRIRGYLNTTLLFDTTSALLVWEHQYFPYYWIPRSAFSSTNAVFEKDKPVSGIESSTYVISTSSPKTSHGDTDGKNGGKKQLNALVVPDAFNSPLAGYVKIDFKDLDKVYEELEEAGFPHPKDPFHRVDVLATGRHVKVEVEGVVVADTGSEGGVVGLWETGFPGRWYLPGTAIQWQYLTKSDTRTGCPYKGHANYYNAVIDGKEVKDVVWYYENPLPESLGVRGLYCFYPDKVRTWVDGEEIERIGMPARPTLTAAQVKGLEEERKVEKEDKTNGYHGKSCGC